MRTILGRVATLEDAEDRPDAAAIRERRVELARRNPFWVEIEETALVPRGRMLVHADTDELYMPYRGMVFHAGSAEMFNERVPLAFHVNRDGGLHFLERQPGTWSRIVAKQAEREYLRNAPRPRRRPAA